MLVVEHHSKNEFRFIQRFLIPSFLGKGSYSKYQANSESLSRSIEAIKSLESKALKLGATEIIAAGTSAMRDYQLSHILDDFPKIQAKVISGNEEAVLVKQAILQLTSKLKSNHLIMDIGGGSVEFSYIADNAFSVSLNAGVRRLQEQLGLGNQLDEQKQNKISEFLEKATQVFGKTQDIKALVGCSGTMETLFQLMDFNLDKDLLRCDSKSALKVLNFWINSNQNQRDSEVLIPEFRAELLPIGFSIIRFYLEKFNIPSLYYSKFGLKEALFFEDLKHRYAQGTDHR